MSCGCSDRLDTLLITTKLNHKIYQYSIKNLLRVVVKHRLKLNKGICNPPIALVHGKRFHCRSRTGCQFTGTHILSLFGQFLNIHNYSPKSPKTYMAGMLLFKYKFNFVLKILFHPLVIT